MSRQWAPGSLVKARAREWVVLPGSDPDFVIARPLNGDPQFTVGLFPDEVRTAVFPDPVAEDDLGDYESAALLRTALRVGFRGSSGPFRSLGAIAVEPRAYQLVPLLLALRQDPVRLLIADDVGVGKTIESALIAKELIEQGSARRLAVLCAPSLTQQWADELQEKFAMPAVAVLPSTVAKLERAKPAGVDFFDHYPVTVVSIDYIKSSNRRAYFLEKCPEIVIVDEAHACVGAGRQRQQRYDLLQQVAAVAERHLLLVTATPHSGKDEAFRQLLGLLKPELAATDFSVEAERVKLARHFIQRRRHDIRGFLDEQTSFPRKRLTQEVAYPLQSEYAKVAKQVLDYARETVRTSGGEVVTRTRWWTALGLLRAVASSPAAAARTLRNIGATGELARTVQEADALGRPTVFDADDTEDIGSDDAIPAVVDDEQLTADQRARREEFAVRFDKLHGPRHDKKLDVLVTHLRGLMTAAYDTIVFCRYIATAEYLHDQLTSLFKDKARVDFVTGALPLDERKGRVDRLGAASGRRVLVATDCLSEGVNLQDAFQAVIHYDLAWNPTRHEQREGRVDRFGQSRNEVRTVTLYGKDNGIDSIVLKVLLRKSRKIWETTGVAVPVPERSDEVMDTALRGLLLGQDEIDQPTLDLDFTVSADIERLHQEWEESAYVHQLWRDSADHESKQRTLYAHRPIDLTEVAAEVTAVRSALGDSTDIAWFVRSVLTALGAHVADQPETGGFTADVLGVAPGVRLALGLSASGPVQPLRFVAHPPAGPGQRALVRTDPAVAGLARHVLESALDTRLDARDRPARRTGVIVTSAVSSRTIVALARYRFHVTLPGGETRVAEDARVVGFRGGERIAEEEAAALLNAKPDDNLLEGIVRQQMERAMAGLDELKPQLDRLGADFADELEAAHRRVRKLASAYIRGLSVRFQAPADVLGLYVYLPGGAR